MHAACLQSFARAGHRVVLHVYAPPADAPKGVETADASLLLDRDRIGRHRQSGSLALAADLFRYELMAAGAGVYVDCDCYCVRPIVERDFLFGWESDSEIGVGVLKVPGDSALLAAMRAIGVKGFIPPWEKSRRRHLMKLRAALGWPKGLSEMPWGTMGPRGFTYYARKFALAGEAQPIDAYYPIHFNQTALLRDPGVRLDDIVTPRTRVIHLWNELLRQQRNPPPDGSPLACIMGSLE